MNQIVLFVVLLFSSPYSISSLQCYISVIPFVLNYSVTVDTLPPFDNCTLVDTSGECTFTILWFRNPAISMIVFGYNLVPDESNLPIDSISASVQYQIDGDEFEKRLSHDVQYVCQSSDGCNSGKNLKRILESLKVEEDFSGRFDSLIAANESFNNQSIRECYSMRIFNDCSPVDYSNCRRCQISMNFSHSSIDDICATCPTLTPKFNSIKRDAVFLLNNRSQIIDHVQLLCQNEEHCNSIENIYEIRRASLIEFNFNKFSYGDTLSL